MPVLTSHHHPPRQTADEFLKNGREALEHGNVNDAIEWYRGAVAANAEFAPSDYSPSSLAMALTQNGVDATLLSTPGLGVAAPIGESMTESMINPMAATGNLTDPARVPRSINADPDGNGISSNSLLERAKEIVLDPTARPAVSGGSPASQEIVQTHQAAAPATNAATQHHGAPPTAVATNSPGDSRAELEKRWGPLRTETLRLLAEAQLAMDRGDLKSAQTLAHAAQNLRVPDALYQSGDTRPWMVLMDIARREDRVKSYQSQTGSLLSRYCRKTPIPCRR